MQKKIAHLFPAFVLKYTGKELTIIKKYNRDFQKRLSRSSKLLGVDLNEFDIKQNNFTDQELKNQVLSYIFSSIFSDILHENKKTPNLISGFSMGLYAALYHAKSVDYDTGLLLINDVFNEVKRISLDEKYAMASVIGFDRQDLDSYISELKSVEVAIQNGSYSFVISGKEEEVKPLLKKLQTEGAIHTSLFNVSFPYHSKILSCCTQSFKLIVDKYNIKNPETPLISMINQAELATSVAIRNEIVKNVTQPLNFFETINTLVKLGTKKFIEVGADTSLLKSSKFIEGDFNFQAIAKGKYL